MQTGTGKAKDSLVVLRCQGRHESIDPFVLSSPSLFLSLFTPFERKFPVRSQPLMYNIDGGDGPTMPYREVVARQT